MRTQKEISEDPSVETLQGNSNHNPCNVFAGKIEALHAQYKTNGLVKVRIPVLHDGWPIDRIPWAKLTTIMRAYCAEWDSPSGMSWSGTVDLELSGTTELSLSGDIEIEGNTSGSLSGTISIPGAGGSASGTVSIEGNVSGTSGQDLSGSQVQEGGGTISMNITPSQYNVFPFKKVRSGAGLLRVGDLVLVSIVNNDENNIVVTDMLF